MKKIIIFIIIFNVFTLKAQINYLEKIFKKTAILKLPYSITNSKNPIKDKLISDSITKYLILKRNSNSLILNQSFGYKFYIKGKYFFVSDKNIRFNFLLINSNKNTSYLIILNMTFQVLDIIRLTENKFILGKNLKEIHLLAERQILIPDYSNIYFDGISNEQVIEYDIKVLP